MMTERISLTKKEYAVTVDENGEKVYTLIDSNTYTYVYDEKWKDELVSYNSQLIAYDAIGNPINYMGSTLTWTMGRQISEVLAAAIDTLAQQTKRKVALLSLQHKH